MPPATSRPEPDDWEIALVESLPRPTRRSAQKADLESRRPWVDRPKSDRPKVGRPKSDGLKVSRPKPNGPNGDATASTPAKRGSRAVPSPAGPDRDAALHAGNAKLEDATRAYSADRYQDAFRILRKLSSQSPSSAPVKELLGLTLYRMGRWPLAVRELLAHHELTGSYDQFPVIADCYRAMRRYPEASAAWEELRQASPSAEVVAEGRLVAAGCLADQGDLSGAVKLLESSLRRSRPKVSHLRQWYALADLYERAGEWPRARDLFTQIAALDPDAYDVRQRLVALG
jgi:tetratricopeptide (TPR) repeat protein